MSSNISNNTLYHMALDMFIANTFWNLFSTWQSAFNTNYILHSIYNPDDDLKEIRKEKEKNTIIPLMATASFSIYIAYKYSRLDR